MTAWEAFRQDLQPQQRPCNAETSGIETHPVSLGSERLVNISVRIRDCLIMLDTPKNSHIVLRTDLHPAVLCQELRP